jgi:predicted RNA-binding Zn-ribbon protein involved in translation (DUF1610 family)
LLCSRSVSVHTHCPNGGKEVLRCHLR